MKKILIIVVAITLAFLGKVNAQYNSVKLISAGTSFGIYGKYYNDYEKSTMDEESSMPVFLQYETGLGDKVDLQGFEKHITMGLFAGFHKQEYTNTITLPAINYEVYRKFNYLTGGVVGTIHGVDLANEHLDITIPADKWDIYLSIKAGLVFEYYRSNYDQVPTAMEVQLGNIDISELNTHFYLAPVVGARYYLIDKVSLFAELGRANLSTFSFGASLKL